MRSRLLLLLFKAMHWSSVGLKFARRYGNPAASQYKVRHWCKVGVSCVDVSPPSSSSKTERTGSNRLTTPLNALWISGQLLGFPLATPCLGLLLHM
ncbi:hypothetical protein F5141DRAFT_1141795 [Pisolithus sp. B1]|nr:hypothetical protein F5141DRAFT_1148500 [Pisolithus sp. B1]KAI6100330.1 hypothetical protein F5141DRAFT_1141795 [Pisolithus sp. B1]